MFFKLTCYNFTLQSVLNIFFVVRWHYACLNTDSEFLKFADLIDRNCQILYQKFAEISAKKTRILFFDRVYIPKISFMMYNELVIFFLMLLVKRKFAEAEEINWLNCQIRTGEKNDFFVYLLREYVVFQTDTSFYKLVSNEVFVSVCLFNAKFCLTVFF